MHNSSIQALLSIAAIKTQDDFVLSGTLAAHTNAGQSYCPSEMLNDDEALQDTKVDLERTLIREVEEERGLTLEISP